jgi:hypothetical protein
MNNWQPGEQPTPDHRAREDDELSGMLVYLAEPLTRHW